MSPVGTECLYQHIGRVLKRRMIFYKHFAGWSIEDTSVSIERIQSRGMSNCIFGNQVNCS